MKSSVNEASLWAHPDKLFTTVAFALTAGYVGGLLLIFFQHGWIADATGKPFVTDFLEVWVAGKSALAGAPAASYDPQAHHAAQVAAAGHSFPGFLLWNYPPLFLLVASLLACLPYAAAFLGWVAATASAYAATIAAIVGRREAAIVACAAPFSFANAIVGQTGFLTAALMGGVLLCVDRRPLLSGVFLGLLTYKPQFGILIPIVFVFAGYWRVLFAATLTASLGIAAAWVAFGTVTYRAFIHYLPVASNFLLTEAGGDWKKMQSAYAIARLLGTTDAVGWIVQGAVTVMCLCAAIWLWRQNISTTVKGAGLALAAMLATPYLHMYDFPMLAVALALLFRDRPFDRVEWIGVAAANLFFLSFAIRVTPIGPLIVLLVMGLVLRRVVLRAETATNLAPQPT